MSNEITLEDIAQFDNKHIKKSLKILYKSNILTQKNKDLAIDYFNNSQAQEVLQFMQTHDLLSEDNFEFITDNIEDAKDIAFNLLLSECHAKTLQLGKYLRYPFESGLCEGFTLRWLEACFLKEEDKFVKRVRQIILSAAGAEVLLAKIKNINEKTKNHKVLTEEDIEVIEILAFYESILLYHLPDKYADFLNQFLIQNDIEPISQVAASEKILHRGGLKTVSSDPFIYTRDELNIYLQNLKNILHECHSNKVDTGILLSRDNHAIGLVFEPENDRFMDINQWPPKEVKVTELVDKIFQGFNCEESLYTAFNAKVITIADASKQQTLFAKLDTLKQNITKEIAQREASEGITLTHIAAQFGHTPAIETLANHGADLDKPANDSITPLGIACQNGFTPAIAALLTHGADPNKLSNGETSTFIASQNGRTLAIPVLAKYGADLDKANARGATPTYVASECGHAPTIVELAKHGANLDTPTNEDDVTPLWIASQNGHIKVVAALAKNGADLNKPNYRGATPAFIASHEGHVQVIRKLAKYGADLKKPTSENGETPKSIALQNGHTQVIDELTKLGVVELNIPSNNVPALFFDFQNEQANIAKPLLALNKPPKKRTREISIRKDYGETLLKKQKVTEPFGQYEKRKRVRGQSIRREYEENPLKRSRR